jgi:hypothetical protein
MADEEQRLIAYPEDYSLIFESHRVGQKVLEDLVARFGNNPYVKGGHEAERQTSFNAGKLEVVNFILSRIDAHNGVDPNSDEETTA